MTSFFKNKREIQIVAMNIMNHISKYTYMMYINIYLNSLFVFYLTALSVGQWLPFMQSNCIIDLISQSSCTYLFNSEIGDRMFSRNVGNIHQDYAVLRPRKQESEKKITATNTSKTSTYPLICRRVNLHRLASRLCCR